MIIEFESRSSTPIWISINETRAGIELMRLLMELVKLSKLKKREIEVQKRHSYLYLMSYRFLVTFSISYFWISH